MKINKIKQMKLADGTTVYICKANKKETRELHARMFAKHIMNQISEEIKNAETKSEENI
jgi:hypothetical protein